MNGNPFTTNYIGSTGQYPIYDYIKNTSNILLSKLYETSNALHNEILETSNITSNICYAISSNVGLLFKSEFAYFMNKDSNNEIYFNDKEKTKINDNGEIFVYHSADNTLPTRAPGFWNVENELTSLIRESTGARFDIVNLQVDTLDIHTLLAEHTASIAGLEAANITQLGAVAGIDAQLLTIHATNALQSAAIAGLETQITATNVVVATKQDALTAETNLLGNGSAITGLNYSNISNISDFATVKQLNLKQNIFDTIERQYPSRLYNSVSAHTATTFLSQSVFTISMTLNNDGSTYDYGTYTLWYSSFNSTNYPNKAFNYNVNENPGAQWNSTKYDNNGGIYLGTTNYIVNDYFGDWLIIKLVKEIKLTKFTFWNRSNYSRGAPGKWKIYGSLDGINWEYIEDASNTLSKAVYPDDLGRSYTKNNIYSTKAYLYFGLVVNEIYGATGTWFEMTEWKIYGVEKMNYQADWNTTIINKPTIINSQWTTSNTNIYYNGSNVGIGTIAPNYKLDVIGTIKTDGLIINNLNFNNVINNTSNGINSNLISTSNALISVINNTSNGINNNLILTSNAINNNLISTSNGLISVINTTSNAINNNLDVVISSQSNLNNNFILYNQIYENSYCKKSTFLIETNNLLNYDSVNYYTYTIDLTKYLKYLQISDITKLLRFKINATLASSVGVFSYLTECEYKIMMSQSSSVGQSGGFHCRAFGYPEDLNLTKFANYKFVKTNNIYQLVYLSAVAGAKFLITIIDEL